MKGTSVRGVVLVLLVASAALVWQPRSLPLELLPADSWIYAAMADEPSVFTARPWGYRLLGPWLVHGLSGSHRGFAYLAPTALVLASLLLFLFLRRLGHGQGVSLVAAAVFALSGPVAVGLENPYLCEPLTVLLEIAFLLAVESGAGLGVLALLAVLAVLSKEILLVLLPLVFLARWPHKGIPRALGAAALVALPALAVQCEAEAHRGLQLSALQDLPQLALQVHHGPLRTGRGVLVQRPWTPPAPGVNEAHSVV